jgi:threonine dehydratase
MADNSSPLPALADYLTPDRIREAARVIAPHVHRTPLLKCRTLSTLTGFDIRLKAENWQKTGSFKPRGALNRIAQLSAGERRRGVLAASAGNHAQGLAYAAAALGIPVKVVMPENTPPAKLEATRGMGAEIVLHGQIFDDALAKSLEIVAESGMAFVHPATDPFVVAGAGTIGMEILEDAPDIDAVVVPVGGGGLISGIATFVRSQRPSVRVFGVVPEQAAAMSRSFREGKAVRLDKAGSIAEGMASRAGTGETIDFMAGLVEDIVEVSERAILDGIVLLLTRAKILAEGAGAGPLAALLERRIPLPPGSRVVLVVSGGNQDLDRLSRWILDGVA